MVAPYLSCDTESETEKEDETKMMSSDLENIPTVPTDNREKMKKNITVLRGIALSIGAIIGTGIFITPNSITRKVNSPGTSIMVWLGGGVIAAAGGMVWCELGTMIPVSGAEVAYIRKIYGPLPAFLSVWLHHFVLSGMGNAIGVLALSQYFVSLFYDDPGADVVWWLSKLTALAVLYVIVALATFKPTLILDSIMFFTTAKVIGTVIIIIAGFVYLAKGNTGNISVGFAGTNTNAKEWGDAWMGVIYSYGGWNYICIVTSELQNPQRNVPIVVLSSVGIVTVLYLLTVTSYHIVLPVSVMIQDIPVASEFGLQAMGEAGKIILALTVVLSTLGNAQCGFLSQSRYIHSGSVEGVLPSCLGLVNKRFRTPLVSILFLAAVATIFVVVGGINNLISTASFSIFPFYVLCSVGVFVMRRTHPDLHRPYRVPLIFPAFVIIFGVYVVILPFLGGRWLISLIWVLVLLLGVPIYFLLLKNVFKLKWMRKCDESLTSFLATLMNCD